LRKNSEAGGDAQRKLNELEDRLSKEIASLKAEIERLDKLKKDSDKKMKKKFDDDLAEAEEKVETEKKKAERLEKKCKKLEDDLKKLKK